MFCSECGTKNEAGTKFCSECGNKLTVVEVSADATKESKSGNKKSNVATKKTKEKVVEPIKEEVVEPIKEEVVNVTSAEPVIVTNKSKSSKNKNMIITLLSLVVIFGGTYYYLNNYVYSPQIVADEFMRVLEDGNYEDLYDLLIDSDSEFVSKDKFEEAFEDYGDSMIDSFEFEKTKIDDDEATVYYEVKYDGDKEDVELELVANSKIFFIFNKWTVDDDLFSFIVEDYEIKVPKDSKISLDGTKIDDKYLDDKESDDENDVYVIPELLATNYDLEVLLPYGITINKEIYASSYDEEYELDYFSTSDISDEDKEELAEDAMNLLQKFYDDATSGIGFAEIQKDYDFEGVDLDDVEDDFNDLVDGINGAYSMLKSLTLSDASVSSISLDDNIINITIEVDIDFTVDKVSYGGDVTEVSDTDKGSYESIYMIYVDGEFRFAGSDYISTYFYAN